MLADLVESMKTAALGAVEASKPVNVFFGNVVSASPLKISVEQKMTLEAPQLVLTRNVTEYRLDMTAGERRAYIVHNGLAVGDKVILIRGQGGQKFIVIDRLGAM